MLQIEMRNEQFQSDMKMRQQIQQEVMQQILQDPQFLQQIMQQMQGAGGPQAGGEFSPGPRGVGEMGPAGQVVPETLIPPETGEQAGAVPAEFAPGATRELQTQRAPGGESVAVE